jgi:hypothetical protein
MKKLVACLLLLVSSANAFADCDWSKGVTQGQTTDGKKVFMYSEACHLAVGKLVQDNKTKDLQIADLNQAITLKDLALKASDDRVMLWSKTAGDEMDRLNKISEDQKRNDWLYFALGVGTTFLAAYSASKLIHN